MVPKHNGTWRPCGDYRRLNSVTVPYTYPVPNMLEFATKAARCTHFSWIDLKKGYHRVLMNEADIPKTVIIPPFGLFEYTRMPFGLFEYTRMPFGLRNAGNTFQRLINRTLSEVEQASLYGTWTTSWCTTRGMRTTAETWWRRSAACRRPT